MMVHDTCMELDHGVYEATNITGGGNHSNDNPHEVGQESQCATLDVLSIFC